MSLGILDLPARVDELERQVAELAGRKEPEPTGSSGLQGNVLTIDPDGTIGADFSGSVATRGVDLHAGQVTTTDNAVEWTGDYYATHAARAIAYDFPTRAELDLEANVHDALGERPAGRVIVTAQAGGAVAGLSADAGPSDTTARAFAGSATRTLIDNAGRSGFLQLLTDANLAAQLGTFNFPLGAPTLQFGGVTNFATPFSGPAVGVFLIPFNGLDLVVWSTAVYTASGFSTVLRWADGIARTGGATGAYLALGPR